MIEWTDIVFVIVAIYGAALSTYNFVRQYYANKPNIKVKIDRGFIRDELGHVISEALVHLSAANVGKKAVTLLSQHIKLPNKKKFFIYTPQSNVTFPHELLPEKSCTIWVKAREIAATVRKEGLSGKVKLIGVYRDQVGRSYKSKPFEFDSEEWLKPSNK